MLRLSVYAKGMLKDELIGMEMIPVAGLRQGYRAVPLRNSKGLRLQLASVLVRFRLKSQVCIPPKPAPTQPSCSIPSHPATSQPSLPTHPTPPPAQAEHASPIP